MALPTLGELLNLQVSLSSTAKEMRAHHLGLHLRPEHRVSEHEHWILLLWDWVVERGRIHTIQTELLLCARAMLNVTRSLFSTCLLYTCYVLGTITVIH